jgi:hypothetical protein
MEFSTGYCGSIASPNSGGAPKKEPQRTQSNEEGAEENDER